MGCSIAEANQSSLDGRATVRGQLPYVVVNHRADRWRETAIQFSLESRPGQSKSLKSQAVGCGAKTSAGQCPRWKPDDAGRVNRRIRRRGALWQGHSVL